MLYKESEEIVVQFLTKEKQLESTIIVLGTFVDPKAPVTPATPMIPEPKLPFVPKISLEKYEHDNKTVRATLLTHMNDPLFNLFTPTKSAKAVWEALDKKFGANDARKRKYGIGSWPNFKMVN